ncbi:MAG: hypothetical protein SFZ23_07755 [Planctomycetota bacterium]|nr:hypothetical protein [Planctomycetota bacterium]
MSRAPSEHPPSLPVLSPVVVDTLDHDARLLPSINIASTSFWRERFRSRPLPLLVLGGRSTSAATLWTLIAERIAMLRSAQVAPGSVVIAPLAETPEWVATLVASWCAGLRCTICAPGDIGLAARLTGAGLIFDAARLSLHALAEPSDPDRSPTHRAILMGVQASQIPNVGAPVIALEASQVAHLASSHTSLGENQVVQSATDWTNPLAIALDLVASLVQGVILQRDASPLAPEWIFTDCPLESSKGAIAPSRGVLLVAPHRDANLLTREAYQLARRFWGLTVAPPDASDAPSHPIADKKACTHAASTTPHGCWVRLERTSTVDAASACPNLLPTASERQSDFQPIP